MTITIDGKTLEEVADKLSNCLYGKSLSQCLGTAQVITKQSRNKYLIKLKKSEWENAKNKKIVGSINSMINHIKKQPDSKVTIMIL